MRFIPLSILPALIAHSALQLAAAWSTQQHRASQEISLAAANRKENDGTIMYTSADITESMRHESQVEMEKVARLLQSKQSSILLIHSKDELIDYLSSNNIQNYLFDCDGVLYRGTDPMPEASQAIQSLLDNGKRVFFVTNNAASSRSELKNKLEKVLRLPEGTLDDDMMIGSAFVAAQYLRSKLIKDKEVGSKRVHVIGTAGLCQEVQTAGFNTSGGPDPIGTPSGMSRDELATYPFSEGGIDALVIGLDNDFNYRKLCIANVLLQRNPDALFVATNRDAFDLVGYDARHLPGNGALVSSIEAASGRTAINVGKPSPVLASWLMEQYNLKADETIMIGDRLDTDVKFGNSGRMRSSALVLTGCTTVDEMEELVLHVQNGESGEERSDMIPTIIFPHVGLMVADR